MNLNPSTQINLFEHKDIFNQLYKLYKNDNLPNKILLSGEKGIGKSTLAYHLINFVLSDDEEHPYDYENNKINYNKSINLHVIIFYLILLKKNIIVDWDTFFYPLDNIHNWNKLYGSRGFAQFQCVIPLNHSKKGITELLNCIANSKSSSFLAVLKIDE